MLLNYTDYADSIQMHPFTSCKQSAQLGERPFPCEEIYYTREKATDPSVYQVLFVLRRDILKNISHYSLTKLETGRTAMISPSVPRVRFNVSRSVHYIKTLASCTPFAMFTYNTQNFSLSLFWQHNMHTVHFCKQVFTTLNKCVLLQPKLIQLPEWFHQILHNKHNYFQYMRHISSYWLQHMVN